MPAKSTAPAPFIIERILNASPALVWRAITTREDIGRWFFDFKNFEARPGVEFEFTVQHAGNTFRHLCKVTEVVPQKRIAYTWRYHGYEGNSLVTIELAANGKKTKVKLTHEGLETFPHTEMFARKNFEPGWTQIIGAELKDLVENFDREIYVSREFNAPRELLWDAMTKPEHVGNWWGPRGFTTTIEKMDFRVGGTWKHVMHGPDGADYPNKSIFKEIVKPEKIVYSHGGGKKGGRGVHMMFTWTFDELGKGKTRVSIRIVFSKVEDRDFVVKEHNAIEGGKETLGRLAEYVKKL